MMTQGLTLNNAKSKSPRKKKEEIINDDLNFGNIPLGPSISKKEEEKQITFPNGQTTLQFDDFINVIKESC
jgi:hypothetical protein